MLVIIKHSLSNFKIVQYGRKPEGRCPRVTLARRGLGWQGHLVAVLVSRCCQLMDSSFDEAHNVSWEAWLWPHGASGLVGQDRALQPR